MHMLTAAIIAMVFWYAVLRKPRRTNPYTTTSTRVLTRDERLAIWAAKWYGGGFHRGEIA